MKQIVAVAAMLVSCSITADSLAAGCDKYADRAVRQNNVNQILACGFSGPRWSSDRGGHANWCLGVSFAAVESEDDARQTQIGACITTRYLPLLFANIGCHTYAQRALEQLRVAEALGCGFSGPRWSNNYDGHYGWCTQRPAEALRAEDQGRYVQLLECARRD